MDNAISVILIENHTLLRRTLRRGLEEDPEIRVVGEAGNGAEAERLVQQVRPEVVVMDLAMPVMDGLHATREIMRLAPRTAVLILSMYAEERDVQKAFAAGARGYLLKSAKDLDLNAAIKEIAYGNEVQRHSALGDDSQ